jgi:ABC-2 type transport system ATP-binding protein
MPIVQLDHIRKVYDSKVAVEDLSFTVEAGTMFGLLGPNGSGKTSSIRMMIGMTLPDSGMVSLFDKPYTRAQLWRIGYLPEERGLYKKMNVLEQLVFLAQLHGMDEAEARRRSIAWCEKLQITEAIPKKVEDLSKGMQQKIQFIAALIHKPALIIMDEPFSGLDPVSAALLMDTLVELRNEGKAVIFSTHRMDQVEKLCDHIALIHRGRLVVSGSMHDVKAAYPHNRVQITYEGDDSFLRHPAIQTFRRFPGQVEIIMQPSDTLEQDTQAMLADAIHVARITHFSVTEPSLEDIFIEKVRQNAPDEDAKPAAVKEDAYVS